MPNGDSNSQLPPRRRGILASLDQTGLRFSERRLLLLLGDLACLSGALAISLAISYSERVTQLRPIWWIALATIWVVFSLVFDCYDLQLASQSPRSAVVSGGTALLVSAAYLVTPVISAPLTRSRTGWWLFAAMATLFVGLWRMLYSGLVRQPGLKRRVLIVGAGRSGRDLVGRLDALGAESGIDICGFVDDDPDLEGGQADGYPVLGNSKHLERLVSETRCNEIVVAVTDPDTMSDRLGAALCRCWVQGVDVTPLPLFFEEALGELPSEHLGSGVFSIMYVESASFQRMWDFGARLLDMALALVGLVVCGVLLPFVALVIKLDSSGPVFFRQVRVGRHGRPFTLLKFRSMVQDAEKGGAVWAQAGDSRVTRTGRLLRKTRIDELPQLWNVLVGAMSLVGPRPERPEFVHDLSAVIPYYDLRHAVRPGLTGWAQVRYPYGNSTDDARAKLRYHLNEYHTKEDEDGLAHHGIGDQTEEDP